MGEGWLWREIERARRELEELPAWALEAAHFAGGRYERVLNKEPESE